MKVTSGTRFSAQALQRMENILNVEIEKGHLPGCVLALGIEDRVVYNKAFGCRDVSDGTPMQTNAIFDLRSLTKCFISALLLTYWEDGLFNMNDPIGKFIPSLARPRIVVEGEGAGQDESLTFHETIFSPTIKQLLTHTSGIMSNTFFLKSKRPYKSEEDLPSFDDPLSTFTDKLCRLPLLFRPGAEWRYSLGLQIIGRLIELLSEMPLGEVMRDRISSPLSLHDTSYDLNSEQVARLAKKIGTKDASFNPVVFGDMGLHATAEDCLRFIQFLVMGGSLDGHRILAKKTVEYALSDHIGGLPRWHFQMPDGSSFDWPEPGYGFGLGFGVCNSVGPGYGPASIGAFYWTGHGSFFHGDPQEKLSIVFLAPGRPSHHTLAPGEYYKQKIRTLIYQALQ